MATTIIAQKKKKIQQYYEDSRGEDYLLLMDAAIYAMRTTHFLTRVEATTPFQFLLSLVVNQKAEKRTDAIPRHHMLTFASSQLLSTLLLNTQTRFSFP